MTLIKVGVYCLRGGGHWACYDEEDASACGTKGPDVFIDVDIQDYQMYPEWLKRQIDWDETLGTKQMRTDRVETVSDILHQACERIAYPVNWPEREAMPGYEKERSEWMQAIAAKALTNDWAARTQLGLGPTQEER